jgi:hypothetical protein
VCPAARPVTGTGPERGAEAAARPGSDGEAGDGEAGDGGAEQQTEQERGPAMPRRLTLTGAGLINLL